MRHEERLKIRSDRRSPTSAILLIRWSIAFVINIFEHQHLLHKTTARSVIFVVHRWRSLTFIDRDTFGAVVYFFDTFDRGLRGRARYSLQN